MHENEGKAHDDDDDDDDDDQVQEEEGKFFTGSAAFNSFFSPSGRGGEEGRRGCDL